MDGYSPINVSAVTSSIDSNIQPENIKKNVTILGVTGTLEGGGIGIPREVSANGVYQAPSSSFTFSLPSTATDIGANAMYRAFYYCNGLTSVDLSSLTTVSGSSAMNSTFSGCTGLTSADLSSLTTVSGTSAMSNAFYNCSGLTSVDLSSLQIIGVNSSTTNYSQFRECFNNCPNLTTLTFPALEAIYCTGGTTTNYGTFAYNTTIQKMYFPKLDTITYGTGASTTNQNACKNVFYGCSGLTELHFAATNQSAIEASPGYSTAWGRGAGNVTIYFDL